MQGGLQAEHTVIDDLGVGYLEHIHAGVGQRRKHLRWSRAQLRAIGISAEDALEIQQCQIRVTQQRHHILEHLRKIKGDPTGGHHLIGDVQIAGSGNMDHGVELPG